MGREELTRALKEKGAAQIESIWQKAREDAEDYRRERKGEVERQSRRCDREAAQSVLQDCRQVDWRVAKSLRRMRLQSQSGLDQKLRRLAGEELAKLDRTTRHRVLGERAAEIPAADWRRVIVHPDDAETVRQYFGHCLVETDRAVGGGLVIETASNELRLDNSLRCRLAMQWPQLCGRIFRELDEADDA